MTTRRLLVAAGAVATLVLGACGASKITAKDCGAKCDETRVSCVEKCTDDACRTRCNGDGDDCKAHCDEIVIEAVIEEGAASAAGN
jgi:hypothetical protein